MELQVNIREFVESVRFSVENGLKYAILGLGAPGIGKSQTIASLAEELGYKVLDLRLPQMSEVEIGGLIYPSEDKKYTTWLRPNWFPVRGNDGNEVGGVPTILLLDELTSAPKRVQVAGYQLVLDRRIGQHVLPDDTVIIALGNRQEDGGVYVQLAAPLADRFEIYNIEVDADIWLQDYATKNLHPFVTSFIRQFPDKLHTQTEDSESMVFATPRSWEQVSRIITCTNGKITDVVTRKIYSCVGDVVGAEFVSFCEKYSNVSIVEDVVNGKDVAVPTDEGSLLYVIDGLVSHLHSSLRKNGVAGTIDLYLKCEKFSVNFPPEFQRMFIDTISSIDPNLTAAALKKSMDAVVAISNSKVKFNQELDAMYATEDVPYDNTDEIIEEGSAFSIDFF